MKILVIGGERHGEWIDGMPDGIRMWVDIEHAARHVVRKITWNVQNIETADVIESFTLYLAVHEQLQGPNEVNIGTQLLQLLAMNEFARSHGERHEIKREPAGASLIVPDTGA